MRSKTKVVLLAVVAAAIGLVALPPTVNRLHEYLVTPPGQSAEDQLSPERKRFMPPERVVQLLNPQTATTVLDLGAGYGLFTIPLAQAVGEHGKVFATDIDSQALASLSEEALKSGLKNIVPVQVRADGLDDFYRQHTFDTILVSDVIPLISELEAFFGQLRSSLKNETGRLWVIDLRLDPDFTMLEFDDWNATENGTLRLGSQPIIVQRLSEKSRLAASTDTTGNIPESLRTLVIDDFNRMLEDPTLWPETRARRLPLNHREGRLRKYLLRTLDREGMLGKDTTITLTPKARRALRFLNRLIIQDLLDNYEWEKAFGLDKLTWPQRIPLLRQIEAGHDYPASLRKVGYELVQEHTALPYHRVWEFKRAR
jgi:ubiquinone/menaquinone biosynthesis C-methylase UbiE